MTCQECQSALELSFDDAVPPSRACLEHAAACPACARMLANHEALERRLHDDKAVFAHTPRKPRSLRWLAWPVAAAAVLAVAILLEPKPQPPVQKDIPGVPPLGLAAAVERGQASLARSLESQRDLVISDLEATGLFLLRCVPTRLPEL